MPLVSFSARENWGKYNGSCALFWISMKTGYLLYIYVLKWNSIMATHVKRPRFTLHFTLLLNVRKNTNSVRQPIIYQYHMADIQLQSYTSQSKPMQMLRPYMYHESAVIVYSQIFYACCIHDVITSLYSDSWSVFHVYIY